MNKISKNDEKSRPFVLWFTGLSSAGKSTLADKIYGHLKSKHIKVERLDGDTVRHIFPDTGFTKEERDKHIKRIGFLASMLEKNDVSVVASFISPYKEARDFVRASCTNFIEVYVKASLETCEGRDVKGLYKKARNGQIQHFTGISAPYEEPMSAEIVIETDQRSVEESFLVLKDYVEKNFYKEAVMSVEQVCSFVADLLDAPIHSGRRLGGSGNSRVYFLQGDSQQYAAKFYFRHLTDKRDRLETEYSGLLFLTSQGMTDIPGPIAINRKESCAIYEFIEGEKIFPGDIMMEDIEYAVDFLARLKKLNNTARSSHIANASEACFSISAMVASIDGRLLLLSNINGKGQEYEELGAFLKEEFKPFLGFMTRWAQEQCARHHISFDSEISLDERTLSPSDFGFHNAIRALDGRIVFLDFEYFGWDDPAKMIVDFMLHPAMNLNESMKKAFATRLLEVFTENRPLAQRVQIVYPLLALKWCIIMLNEFIPDDFSRREYAAQNPLDKAQVRKEKILKVKNLFRTIKETYATRPTIEIFTSQNH